MLEEGDFASDYHLYGLERTPEWIRFFVDGILIGEVNPPPGGFWELGGFETDPGGPNLWANGTIMTPFDYPVSYRLHTKTKVFFCLFVWFPVFLTVVELKSLLLFINLCFYI